jgi:5-methylthioadenosine/S-adenosylhomocysteine deaminase
VVTAVILRGAAAVLTMDDAGTELAGADVLIRDGVIAAVGMNLYADDADLCRVAGCVVTPGLVNTHQHLTGDPLLQSCVPDTIGSKASINDWAVPIHAAHEAGDDEVAATLEALRCLRAGTTTIVEAGTVAHPDRVAAGVTAAGARCTVGCWGWDVEGAPFAAPAGEVLDRLRAVVERWPPGAGLIEGWVTLVGHDLASDELLAGAAELARSSGTGMTMHLSPTAADPEAYRLRTGRRPVEHLDSLGVLGPHLLLAHAVWLDEREVELLLDNDVAIAYCPWAYLRLAQGVTVAGRHSSFLACGGRLGLGCDAANAGDHHDLLRVAALAAGLARDASLRPSALDAATAFGLATVGGAAAARLDHRIGSIEPGKEADLVVFEPDGVEHGLGADPALQLVWGSMRARDVVVGGEVVVRRHRSTRIDEAALLAEADRRRGALLGRAGIVVPHTWPHIGDRPATGQL